MILVSINLNKKIKELEQHILFKDSLINKIDSIKFDIESIKNRNKVIRIPYEKDKESIFQPVPNVSDSILFSRLKEWELRFYDGEKNNSQWNVDNE